MYAHTCIDTYAHKYMHKRLVSVTALHCMDLRRHLLHLTVFFCCCRCCPAVHVSSHISALFRLLAGNCFAWHFPQLLWLLLSFTRSCCCFKYFCILLLFCVVLLFFAFVNYVFENQQIFVAFKLCDYSGRQKKICKTQLIKTATHLFWSRLFFFLLPSHFEGWRLVWFSLAEKQRWHTLMTG